MIILTCTPISCACLMVAAESSRGGSRRLISPASSQVVPCRLKEVSLPWKSDSMVRMLRLLCKMASLTQHQTKKHHTDIGCKRTDADHFHEKSSC